jgi:hypothetical protein
MLLFLLLLGWNSYFFMGYVCFVVVSPKLPHEQAMVNYPLLMSFRETFFNRLH